jgi:hypothetical protein
MTEHIIRIDSSNYIKQYNPTFTYQGYFNPLTEEFNGKGRIKYLYPESPIDIYDGEFIEGKLNGNGTIIYKNSDIYKGQILNFKRNGFGSMYSSNGKFLYDGFWHNDNINKPIYVKKIIGNILSFQGFTIYNSSTNNDEYYGWCVEYDNGFMSHLSFYQDGIPIKGIKFMKSANGNLFEYIINANANKLEITKFMNDLFDKLSKPDNLIEFISNLDNMTILERISYLYESGTKNILPNTSYIIGNELGLIDENYYLDNTHIKVIHFKNDIIIGIYDIANNIFTNGKKYIKSTNSKYISHISNIDSNIDYLIKNCTLIESGNFIYNNNQWLLNGNGSGIKYYNSNCIEHKGIFLNGRIIEGSEIKSNIKIYEGKFNEFGAYEGIGTLYLPNGCIKYQGDFVNGKEHGNGSSYYQNDCQLDIIEYVGEWYNGIKHGVGTLFSIGGDEIYTGQFDNDQIA